MQAAHARLRPHALSVTSTGVRALVLGRCVSRGRRSPGADRSVRGACRPALAHGCAAVHRRRMARSGACHQRGGVERRDVCESDVPLCKRHGQPVAGHRPEAKRVHRAGADIPFLGNGYSVDPAPPSTRRACRWPGGADRPSRERAGSAGVRVRRTPRSARQWHPRLGSHRLRRCCRPPKRLLPDPSVRPDRASRPDGDRARGTARRRICSRGLQPGMPRSPEQCGWATTDGLSTTSLYERLAGDARRVTRMSEITALRRGQIIDVPAVDQSGSSAGLAAVLLLSTACSQVHQPPFGGSDEPGLEDTCDGARRAKHPPPQPAFGGPVVSVRNGSIAEKLSMTARSAAATSSR